MREQENGDGKTIVVEESSTLGSGIMLRPYWTLHLGVFIISKMPRGWAKWTRRQPTNEKWTGPWVYRTPWKKKGILGVAGLKTASLHVSALNTGS